MYHLFNRIYLDHEKRYHTNHDFTLVYEKEGAHPISRQSSFPFPAVPSFRSYLKEKFNGSEEDFWKDLIMKPSTKKYFLFVDSNLLLNLKLQFWKSIFENLEAENAYKLYKFDCMDSTLKRFMYRNRVGSFYDSSNEERIDYEEFKSRFEKTVTIKCLSEMDKSEVSFEYLLGDYFFNKNSQYSFAFRSKLKDLSWKIWFNDMEILKSELINSFYDINRVVPSFQFSLDDFSNLENMIIGHPQLKWMLDPEFHDENIDYVKNNYDPDLFIQLAKSFRDLWDLKILSNDPEILSKVQIQDKILPTEKLFKEQYFELLEENVEKNMGCLFVDEYLRDKANQILPSFIYEKIRNGSTEELQFLMLKRGTH